LRKRAQQSGLRKRGDSAVNERLATSLWHVRIHWAYTPKRAKWLSRKKIKEKRAGRLQEIGYRGERKIEPSRGSEIVRGEKVRARKIKRSMTARLKGRDYRGRIKKIVKVWYARWTEKDRSKRTKKGLGGENNGG